MLFDKRKKDCLEKKDKSRKGSIDKHIKSIVDLINSKEHYYTTSSCSGRIVLIQIGQNQKLDSKWLFTSHDVVAEDDFLKAVHQPFNHKLWIKFESSIIHVCCRTIDDANAFLKKVTSIGMKRSGIIAMDKRIMIEIIGTEGIESLIGVDGKLLASDELILEILEEANRKMERNLAKLNQVYISLRDGL